MRVFMSVKPPKYIFGCLPFTSQDGVKQHAASIRQVYSQGTPISKPADIAFLTDLIEGHIERDDKVGPGIARFHWDIAPDHPSECFYLTRTDGSVTDFGVLGCLKGIGAIARINRQSLRMAIQADIDKFKQDRLGNAALFVSDYSGNSFPAAEAVADHVRTFDEIIEAFFCARRIDLSTALLTKSSDMSSNPVWRNPALVEEFIAFHRRYPLRLVQWRENVSEIAKENNRRRKATLGS